MFKRMFRSSKNILDDYVKSAPGPQNALDIFDGQWSSTLLEPHTELEVGNIPLFNDDRLAWGVAALVVSSNSASRSWTSTMRSLSIPMALAWPSRPRSSGVRGELPRLH